MKTRSIRRQIPLSPSSILALMIAATSVACGGEDGGSANDAPGAKHDEDHDHDHDHDHDAEPVNGDDEVVESTHLEGRLLVSDGAEGRVIVIDLEAGEAIASLSTEGAARVIASSDGSRGFAVQASADAVQGIDPGLSYESHGDHFDVEESDPELLSELVVSCIRPVHFVPHHGYSAAFCDGDGMLHVFKDTRDIASFEPSSFDSGRPHHGVGLVAFDHVILSQPNLEDEEDALPVGVRVLSLAGDEEALFAECPNLHGEAATENHVCFGCSDGLLCVQDGDDGLTSVKVNNPADAAEGLRVGTLKAAASDVFVGNWGEDLVLADLDEQSLSPISLGEAYLSFALSEDGTHVFVLTTGGSLKKIELTSGDVVASADVFPEFEVEPGHSQLKPSFILSENHAYVVDPRHAEVYELTLSDLELTARSFELEAGSYNSLALVGLPPHDMH